MSRLSPPDADLPALLVATPRGDKPCHDDAVFLAGNVVPLKHKARRPVKIVPDGFYTHARYEHVHDCDGFDYWRQENHCVVPPLPGRSNNSPATQQRSPSDTSAHGVPAPYQFAGFARLA